MNEKEGVKKKRVKKKKKRKRKEEKNIKCKKKKIGEKEQQYLSRASKGGNPFIFKGHTKIYFLQIRSPSSSFSEYLQQSRKYLHLVCKFVII